MASVRSRTTTVRIGWVLGDTSLRLPQIAQELGVRYALERGVRKAGDRLRVSAQFIDTETEEHLWSERFDGVMDDVFEIQDRVSAAITEALSIVLTPAEKKAIRDRRMPDAEALDHYLRAQQPVILFNPDRMEEALIELEALLEEREDHMALLRGAAYLRWQMVNAGVSTDPAHFRKVDEYIERMEALDPGTPWAIAFRGMKRVFGAAEEGCLLLIEAFEAGLERDPDALFWTSGVLGMMGLHDLGERYVAELKSIDPKGQPALIAHWIYATYRGRWAKALQATDELPEDLMGGSGRPMLGAWVLGCSGDIEGARERLERRGEYRDGGAWALLANALLKAYRGDRDGLLEYTEDEPAVAWQDFQYSALMADAYAQTGAHEEALEWLGHAVEIGFYCAEFTARQNEHLAGLRDHPEFKDIVKQAQLGSARMRGRIADRMRESARPVPG